METFLVITWFIGAVQGITQCPNKTELDICLNKIAPHMPRRGLPGDRKELHTMCKAFKGGMRCVDGYTARCLSQVERAGLEEHLQGARSTLAFFCDDPVFQREYLSHGSCMKDVQEDWDRCRQSFKYLVHEQHRVLNVSDAQRDHKICCIRLWFLSCVYDMSYLKCGKTQAVFLKKVTATLSYSDVHQEKCSRVKPKECSSATPSAGRLGSSRCFLSLLLMFAPSLVLLVGAWEGGGGVL